MTNSIMKATLNVASQEAYTSLSGAMKSAAVIPEPARSPATAFLSAGSALASDLTAAVLAPACISLSAAQPALRRSGSAGNVGAAAGISGRSRGMNDRPHIVGALLPPNVSGECRGGAVLHRRYRVGQIGLSLQITVTPFEGARRACIMLKNRLAVIAHRRSEKTSWRLSCKRPLSAQLARWGWNPQGAALLPNAVVLRNL
jgi:hypothetical protein